MSRQDCVELRSSRFVEPGDLGRLRRAFTRLTERRPQVFPHTEVVLDGSTFCVRMETTASPEACEFAFLGAWYDAFGERWTPVRVTSRRRRPARLKEFITHADR